jgi:hypothetical protein
VFTCIVWTHDAHFDINYVLWNRSASLTYSMHAQKTRSFCPATKYRGFGCARAGKTDNKGMAGETPSSTARLYSNERNCYSSRRHVDTPSCFFPLGLLVLFRSFNAFVLFRPQITKLLWYKVRLPSVTSGSDGNP